jgi:DNA repair protein RecO (recombination protein O)
MGIEKMEAIVMRTFPFGDTSRIAHLFSAERGRVHVLAKGARGPRGRFGAALEPFTRIGVVVYYRNGREVQFLSQAEILGRRAVLSSSIVRFAYGAAVIELLDQALAGEEPPGPLFSLIDLTLAQLETVPEEALRAAFMGYIARFLSVLGYRPELGRCVTCGRSDSGVGDGNGNGNGSGYRSGEARAWSALRGGLLCRRCASREPTATPLADEVREGLRALLGDGEDGQGYRPAALPRPLGDDMARLLDGFLRAHLPRYRGLRSLKMVRELGAVG